MNEKYLIGILIVLGLFTTVAGLAQVGAIEYRTPILDAVENPLIHQVPVLGDDVIGGDAPRPTPDEPRPYPYQEPDEPAPYQGQETGPSGEDPVEEEVPSGFYYYTEYGNAYLKAGGLEFGKYMVFDENVDAPQFEACIRDAFGQHFLIKFFEGTDGILRIFSVGPYTEPQNETPVVNNTTDVEPEVNNTTDIEPEVNNTTDVEPAVNNTTDIEPAVNNTTDVEPEVNNTTDVEPVVPGNETTVSHDMPERNPDEKYVMVSAVKNATADIDEIESTNTNSTSEPDNDNEIVMQNAGNGIILAIIAIIAILGAVVYIRRKV